MKFAGGIIGIIAGIFGVISAGATLLIGGLGGALQTEGFRKVVGLGFGGVLFSFLVIVFGAISIGAKTKTSGLIIILSSIFGIILGGTLAASFMVLSLVGGILAAVRAKVPPSIPSSLSIEKRSGALHVIRDNLVVCERR